MKRVKIAGERGRWTAEVENRRLAVLHNSWRVGTVGYYDPMVGAKLDGKKYLELVEALRTHDEAVLQRDADPDSLARNGYIGVFGFTNLKINSDGSIELEFLLRIADPA